MANDRGELSSGSSRAESSRTSIKGSLPITNGGTHFDQSRPSPRLTRRDRLLILSIQINAQVRRRRCPWETDDRISSDARVLNVIQRLVGNSPLFLRNMPQVRLVDIALITIYHQSTKIYYTPLQKMQIFPLLFLMYPNFLYYYYYYPFSRPPVPCRIKS